MTSLQKMTSPLQRLHSQSYEGEWINVLLGQGKIDRRFLKPDVIFQNPSGKAICIGNGKSRLNRPLKKIEHSNNNKILQYYNVLYACNGVYKEWMPDFLIMTHQIMAAGVPEEYRDITYSTQEITRRYPGYNLLPGNPRLDAGSAAAYLACFHGAKKVFLFGYDGQPQTGYNNNVYAGTENYPNDKAEVSDNNWIRNLGHVMVTYNDVEFFRVTPQPEDRYRSLLRLPNYKPINFNQFISFADL